jgi:hypothetical protein
MGGLIARSYMQHYRFNDYDRDINLITLATPHHGTPAANHNSRNQLAENANERDKKYYFSWGPINGWEAAIGVGSAIENYIGDWQNMYHVSQDEPNRSDLRWDNYDSVIFGNNDINTWLHDLDSNHSYDRKITAYYGYLDPENEDYESEVVRVYNISPLTALGSLALKGGNYEYLAGSIAIAYGMYKDGFGKLRWPGFVRQPEG